MEFNIEQQIIHQMLLRSGEEKNIGLCNGKMGLVLIFMLYSKLTHSSVYEDIADELMSEIVEEIHNELSIGFDSGLSGIGWGIEYLIQNKFLEGNSLEICEEIDKKIMEKDPRRITDFTFETGLGGILHYVLAHIKGAKQCSYSPFDNIYLHNLFEITSQLYQNTEISGDNKKICEKYMNFYIDGRSIDYSMKISNFIEKKDLDENNLNKYSVGLKMGLGGALFNKLKFSE